MVTKERLLDKAMEAMEDGEDTVGFCRACGAQADGVEPDARKYECESCGEFQVFGAEELIVMLA
jgi:hypothetical protein